MRNTSIPLEHVVFILMRGLFLLLAAVALSVLVYAMINLIPRLPKVLSEDRPPVVTVKPEDIQYGAGYGQTEADSQSTGYTSLEESSPDQRAELVSQVLAALAKKLGVKESDLDPGWEAYLWENLSQLDPENQKSFTNGLIKVIEAYPVNELDARIESYTEYFLFLYENQKQQAQEEKARALEESTVLLIALAGAVVLLILSGMFLLLLAIERNTRKLEDRLIM
ncbi:MAG: hypothetical protein QXP51_04915 [Candidatus Hadarchaeales archaeon]